ncbi:MAG: hypothetical protein CMN98_09335 [Synechococcus sp. NP17]|jgi:hypothetical protein|nr:hypothetical protein [Synechococcus sp. NP17]|tara:strand:- start:43 stop:360 length:318 start_codon:yes stop_codon:yes gene_type:complete
MTSSAASRSSRSQIAIATGFLGAFIVGSLAVQMVRSQVGTAGDSNRSASNIAPVIASQATLWADLGSRSDSIAPSGVRTTNASTKVDVKPVVGSEATLWSDLGSR